MEQTPNMVVQVATYQEYGTEAERVAYDTSKVPSGKTLTFYVCSAGKITNIWKYNSSVGWAEL